MKDLSALADLGRELDPPGEPSAQLQARVLSAFMQPGAVAPGRRSGVGDVAGRRFRAAVARLRRTRGFWWAGPLTVGLAAALIIVAVGLSAPVGTPGVPAFETPSPSLSASRSASPSASPSSPASPTGPPVPAFTDARAALRAVAAKLRATAVAQPHQFLYTKSMAGIGPADAPIDPARITTTERWESVDASQDGFVRNTGGVMGLTLPEYTMTHCRPDASSGTAVVACSGGPAVPTTVESMMQELRQPSPMFDVLVSGHLPAQAQALVFEAAARLSVIAIDAETTDLAGRRGVAVTFYVYNTAARYDFIFDPGATTYLGYRFVGDGSQSQMALIRTGIVDKIKQEP